MMELGYTEIIKSVGMKNKALEILTKTKQTKSLTLIYSSKYSQVQSERCHRNSGINQKQPFAL